jgi:RNA polymerase sigma-70 factor, ECF subfamily
MLAAVASLRAFAISLSGNVDRADDLVQETLLRAIANIHSFQPGSHMAAWPPSSATCSARNTVSAAAESKTPDRAAQPGGIRGIPRGACKAASGQREALLLVGASGFSYEEPAAICETAVGTIKSRVNRARARCSPSTSADRFGQDHTTRAVPDRGRARLIGSSTPWRLLLLSETVCWTLPTLGNGKIHRGSPNFPTSDRAR